MSVRRDGRKAIEPGRLKPSCTIFMKKAVYWETLVCITDLCNTQELKDGHLCNDSATRRMIAIEAVVAAAVLAVAITMSVNGCGILEL